MVNLMPRAQSTSLCEIGIRHHASGVSADPNHRQMLHSCLFAPVHMQRELASPSTLLLLLTGVPLNSYYQPVSPHLLPRLMLCQPLSGGLASTGPALSAACSTPIENAVSVADHVEGCECLMVRASSSSTNAQCFASVADPCKYESISIKDIYLVINFGASSHGVRNAGWRLAGGIFESLPC